MKPRFTNLFSCILVCIPIYLSAQGGQEVYFAQNDTFCFTIGQAGVMNVQDNDTILFAGPDFMPIIQWDTPQDCFKFLANGVIEPGGNVADCCGDTINAFYFYSNCQAEICSAIATIIVKCPEPKPDCFLINIEQYAQDDISSDSRCAYACSFSTATFFATYNPSSTYVWSVIGGTFVPGSNPAEIIVSWGPAGPGVVSVSVTNGGFTDVINACVKIQEGPTANFLASATQICKNGSITFNNNSFNASSVKWDFGDGTTSSMPNPTHTYTTSGTYQVCLIAVKNNFDDQGNPLCCCTDTMCMDIIVEALEGPKVYCVSTLCAKDSTKYWTDAKCDSYHWVVEDVFGLPVPFTGEGNDTICVTWGDGPLGYVTLFVEDCIPAVCTAPTQVIIPIISATTDIVGPSPVCVGETHTYTVPKWMSVYYDWEVSGAISWSGEGTNSIAVHWGSAGVGTITLHYYSEFLGGLPGHDQADCAGTATLLVEIRPEFTVQVMGGTQVCVNGSTTFNTIPSVNCNWVINGGPTPSSSGNGTNSFTVNWDSGPGNYTVVATPLDPTLFCNKEAIKQVRVKELKPPSGIDGPDPVCPGGTYTYFAQTTEAGVGFIWNVTNGTPTNPTGNPITITWGLAGPYSIDLQQVMLSTPFCTSAAITVPIHAKKIDPFTINIGDPDVCINTVAGYGTTPQTDPDAVYTWSVANPLMGSVVHGQGTDNIQVQWNNVAGTTDVELAIELCGVTQTQTFSVTIHNPPTPVIVQNIVACPDVPFTLCTTASYDSWQWSNSETTQCITVANAGVYKVTVTANNCTATASFTATTFSAPPIYPPETIHICGTPSVTLNAPGGPFTYSWTCNGLPAGSGNTLIHTNSNTGSTFQYVVTLTNADGCTSTTQFTVVELIPPCGVGGCNPDPAASVSFTATNQTPNCATIHFVSSYVNSTFNSWDFGDPGLGSIIGGTNGSPFYTYSQAGDFIVTLYGMAGHATLPPPDSCQIFAVMPVHVPLVAKFDCSMSCSTLNLSNQTSFTSDPGDLPGIWAWDFGDLNTSNLQNPAPHTYAAPGTYTVTLTVTNANGCVSTYTKTVSTSGVEINSIMIVPTEVCVGTPLTFSGNYTGTPDIYDWSFGDGATNGAASPLHTYLSDGTFLVTLKATDENGCMDVSSTSVVVHPLPADDVIVGSPSNFMACQGDVVLLGVLPVPGYTYQWSDPGGSTTNSIAVLDPGTYSVTITDPEGCTTVPEPVTVVIVPLPEATISGNHYICDGGCIQLQAPLGAFYTYQWFKDGMLMSGKTFNWLSACTSGMYQVQVTDQGTPLGCSSISEPFEVVVTSPPPVGILVSPMPACEGTPTTLTIDPVLPNVSYTWNTGETATTITVSQPGDYIVVATDLVTGCFNGAFATVHPLPDLCLIPAGCYDACDPDTICGPEGYDYQWYKDGVPISGETGHCLIVSESGTYTAAATSDEGCTAISDPLMLHLIDCTCFGVTASATPTNNDSCCWKLNYTNPLNTLFGLNIVSLDATTYFDPGSVAGGLAITGSGVNSVALANSTAGLPLPSGNLNGIINACLHNVTQSPQRLVFNWLDAAGQRLCSDTVEVSAQLTAAYTLSLCPGSTVVLGGNTYSPPAVVTVNLPGVGGTCDTLATFTLLELPVQTVSIDCPDDITVNAPPNSNGIAVSYPMPTATTTCPGSIPALSLQSGQPSGNLFPVGETDVCYRATVDANCCALPDDCCFKVTVTNEDPCDEKSVSCVKFDFIDITKDAAGYQTYRMRITNNCSNKLIYAAFEVPSGFAATAPANNSTYTAQSGRNYVVRNPNFSPYYSVRFKSTTDSIANGQSDVFEYVLPPQVCHGCVLATVRLATQVYYQAHLCCAMSGMMSVSNTENVPTVWESRLVAEREDNEWTNHTLAVYPNPTDGMLFADLSSRNGEPVTIQVFNSQGQRVLLQQAVAADTPYALSLPQELANGLYILELQSTFGERETARFVLQRD